MNKRWLAMGVAGVALIVFRPATAGTAEHPSCPNRSPNDATPVLCENTFDEKIPDHGMIRVDLPAIPPPANATPPTPSSPEERIAKLEAQVKLLTQENKDRLDEIRVLKGQVNAMMTQIRRLGERLNALDGKGGGPRG